MTRRYLPEGVSGVKYIIPYFFWLGREAERLMRDEDDALFFRNEVIARRAEWRVDEPKRA